MDGTAGADVAVLVVYLAATVALGLVVSCRSDSTCQRIRDRCCARCTRCASSAHAASSASAESHAEQASSARAYFLAGRSTHALVVGLSLFASNIGSEHFVGLAASGAATGLSVAWGEWLSVYALLVLAWLFLPRYLALRIVTLPQFVAARFGRAAHLLLSGTSLLVYVLAKLSVSLYAGAIVLQVTLDLPVWASCLVLVAATAVYTVLGGLRAVVITEFVQALVFIVGGATVLGMCLAQVGGLDAVLAALPDSYAHLFQPTDGGGAAPFPWAGVLFGLPYTSLWYWCTDQSIVQRALSARDLPHGRAGCIFASALKLLPVFLIVVPGMAARVLFASEVAAAPNLAYPLLIVRLLPAGLRGLVIAAVAAALMSSLASVFNSASTLVVYDFWSRCRPRASSREQLIVGRVATVVCAGLAIAWIPVIPLISTQMYVYTHKVMAYLAPPITIVFLAAVLAPDGGAGDDRAVLLRSSPLHVERAGPEREQLQDAHERPQELHVLSPSPAAARVCAGRCCARCHGVRRLFAPTPFSATLTLVVGFSIGLARLVAEVGVGVAGVAAPDMPEPVRTFVHSNFLLFSASYGALCVVLLLASSAVSQCRTAASRTLALAHGASTAAASGTAEQSAAAPASDIELAELDADDAVRAELPEGEQREAKRAPGGGGAQRAWLRTAALVAASVASGGAVVCCAIVWR